MIRRRGHRLDRTDIHDHPRRGVVRFIQTFDELFRHRLIDQKGAANIRGDNAIEIIFGCFKKRRRKARAHRMGQNINTPICVKRLGDDIVNMQPVCDFRMNESRLGAGIGEFFRNRLARDLIRVGEQQVVAIGRETSCAGCADAARRAGDDDCAMGHSFTLKKTKRRTICAPLFF